MSEDNHIPPERYVAPMCEPITRRVMMAGVPFEALMFMLFVGMQLMNLGAFMLLLSVPLAYWALKVIYERDPFGPTTLLDHVRAVLAHQTRLEE